MTSEEKTQSDRYQNQVLDFVHLAGQFISTLDESSKYGRFELVSKLQRVLPELYLKACDLPDLENLFEEANQKFVTEYEYERLRNALIQKFGYLDDYLEIIEPDFNEADGPVPASLSEDLADIYQDLKDFLSLYQIGNEEVMNDALWEVKMNFEKYWGQKLTNALKRIHQIITSEEEIQEEDTDQDPPPREIDTSDWFVSRRQEDYRNDS